MPNPILQPPTPPVATAAEVPVQGTVTKVAIAAQSPALDAHANLTQTSPDSYGSLVTPLSPSVRRPLTRVVAPFADVDTVTMMPSPASEQVHSSYLDRYEEIRIISTGGQAEIVLVRDKTKPEPDNLFVARKMRFASSDDFDNIRRETEACNRLKGDHFLKLHGTYFFAGKRILILDYIDGQNLQELLDSQGQSPDEALLNDIRLQLQEALTELHAEGIIHRDLSLANIMMDRKGRLKILDFGSVRFDTDRTSLATRRWDYTLYFASPEQMHGGDITSATDIWSAGIVLACLALGGTVRNTEGHRLEVQQILGILVQRNKYSREFLENLAAMLHNEPEQRRWDRDQTITSLLPPLDVTTTASQQKVVSLTGRMLAEELAISPDRAEQVLERVVASIKNSRKFKKALILARANAKGKVYLVGSQVYRAFIQALYGLEISEDPSRDFDFLVDGKLTFWTHVPDEVRIEKYSEPFFYGGEPRYRLHNPFQIGATGRRIRTFTGPDFSSDVFTLAALSHVPRTSDNTLLDYLRSLPLALQMMSFDPKMNRILVVDQLPKGIGTREVHTNNQAALEFAANRENLTTADYIATKSRNLGFSINPTQRPQAGNGYSRTDPILVKIEN